MATKQLERVIQTLRRAGMAHDETLSDGQLLESYIQKREETAFAALVRRHGPMVWGVCRRVLGTHHDAEDAFQATFLVLVRKAASIAPKDMVGNWLYGVAQQTALKARTTTGKRQAREKQVTVMPEPSPGQPSSVWNDLQRLLDQELGRLPDKYRAVIVLCDLEGKTRKEAARHFHMPEGTIASRLATARTMLARRLARSRDREGAVSGAMLGAMLSQQAAVNSVPASVAFSTIKAAGLFAAGQATAGGVISVKAVALAEGVLKTMFLTKLKIATAVLLAISFLGTGAAALTRHEPAEQAATAALSQPTPAQQPADQQPAKEQQAVQPAKANQNDEPLPASVSGIARAVDALNNTIAVAHRDGETIFGVRGDAAISIDGKPAKLAGIPAGAAVVLSQFIDHKTARCLSAEGAQINGIARAVSIERRTIAVNDTTYPVATDAHVAIDHKLGKLEQVPAGANVSLNLQVDQKTVLRISAEGSSVFGTVKAVDTQRNSITVAGNPNDRTFSVPADSAIVIDGKPGRLADIPPGASLHALSLRVDQQSAHGMNVMGPGFHHVPVRGVDAAQNSITIDTQAPADVAGKMLRVALDANIEIDGKPGKLAGIPAGAFVNLGLSVDRQTARNLRAEGPNLGGCGGSMVKVVDAYRNTITFDEKGSTDVAGKTFTIGPDAWIQIDGRPGKLANLPSGSFVNLTLRVDRQTVRSVGAQGPRATGAVKALDAVKNTITVDDKTYTLAKDSITVIDGKLGRLADLPVGASVNVNLRVDQKTAAMIQTAPPK